MNIKQKIGKNISTIIISNFINKIINIALLSYLTRYLGTEQFGSYSFVFFYVGLFGNLTDLGINTILVKDIARDRTMAGKILGNGILLRFILTLSATALAFVIICFLDYPMKTKILVYVFSLNLFFSFRMITFRQVYDVAFQVNLKMEYPASVNVLNEILSLGLIIWVIRSGGSLFYIILTGVAANIPGMLAIAWLSKRFIIPVFSMDFALWKRILLDALPIGLASGLIGISSAIGAVMLSKIKGDTQLGYYSLAYRLSTSLWILSFAYMTSLFPLMSSYYKTSKESLWRMFNQAFKNMALIALPIGIGGTIMAEPAIILISGKNFIHSVPALYILIWQTVLNIFTTLFFFTLNAIDKQKINILNSCIMLIFNSAVNFVLIQRSGYMGACWAFVLTEGLGIILGGWFVLKYRLSDKKECIRAN